MTMLTILSAGLLLMALVPLGYLCILTLAALRPAPPTTMRRVPSHRCIIAVPAHDEADVIEDTVRRLMTMDYPRNLFSVHIVADHCTDATAALARGAGAIVHERAEEPRTGKGPALSWLLERVLDGGFDAVVIFDADTRVERDFLRVMDARLAGGDEVIQGQHIISNPGQGWFPALTWAMFLVDNRFQNLGRANLGWSAKHMGDSICFRADILRRIGWGEGLTEDYQLRQRLLLEGIRIAYEPAARGYGEAPRTWRQAQLQRSRWLRGTHDASQKLGRRLLAAAVKRRNAAMLDGALQATLPSFSTLTLACGVMVAFQATINAWTRFLFPRGLMGAWVGVLGLLFVYPFVGLALERAPLRAYLAILSGPLFIVWRTWLAVKSRFGGERVVWVRTAHGSGGRTP